MEIRRPACVALALAVVLGLDVGLAACTGDDDVTPPPSGVDAHVPAVDSSVPAIDAARPDASGADQAAPDATAPDASDAAAPPSDASEASVDAEAGAEAEAGPTNFALRFDGTQYLRVPHAASVDPASVTVEAWFRLEATPVFNAIVSKPVGTGISDTYAIWASSTSVGTSDNNATISAQEAPVLGVWHHLAMTGDGASHVHLMYFDGTLVANQSTFDGTAYDTHDLLIGVDNDNGSLTSYWVGELDDVRVFNVVRSQAEVQADMQAHRIGPAAGLVGEWTFDEGTGATAVDSSGTGNAAVLGATAAAEASDPTYVDVASLAPPDAGHD
jgi:hypothetical protein